MPVRRLTWIIDLDDTLAPCETHYVERIDHLWEYLTIRMGPGILSRDEMQVIAEQENARLIEECGGFAKDIFPTSFVNVYRNLAGKQRHPEDPMEIASLLELGWSVFDEENYRNTLYPGVREALDFLVAKGDALILYTKGDDEIQRMKVRVNSLDQFFLPEDIRVTQNKTTKEMHEIVGRRSPSSVIAVGNSIRSDINTATRAGVRALYYENATWSYEVDRNGIEHPHLVAKIESFSVIPSIDYSIRHRWDAIALRAKPT